MDTLWIALIVTLVSGGIASAYLRVAARGRFEASAGLESLEGMHLREFSRFVLDAMKYRGFDVDQNVALTHPQPSFRILIRDGKHWLLSCRHGETKPITPMDVRELVDAIRLERASGGFLVTTGEVGSGARKAARKTRLELVFGTALWTEIAPYLPEILKQDASDRSADRSKWMLGFVWLAALALGAATWLVLDHFPNLGAPVSAKAGTVMIQVKPQTAIGILVPMPAATATTEPVETASAAEPISSSQQADPAQHDPAQETRERNEVAQAISGLPGIDRAVWSSHSTLLVHLQNVKDDPTQDICAVLERHEALVTSRLMLQPPPGSAETVRFRQCQAVWSGH